MFPEPNSKRTVDQAEAFGSLGFLSTGLAHRVGKPHVPELLINVEYDLGGYYRPVVPVGTVAFMEAARARYSLSPNAGTTEGHADGRGRSKKRGATVFNQCL